LKLAEDPTYKEQCRDSQKHWRDKNRTYMERYRAGRQFEHEGVAKSTLLKKLRKLRSLVKNNSAFKVRPCDADIWVLCPNGCEVVKNTLAPTQIIVLASVMGRSLPNQEM